MVIFNLINNWKFFRKEKNKKIKEAEDLIRMSPVETDTKVAVQNVLTAMDMVKDIAHGLIQNTGRKWNDVSRSLEMVNITFAYLDNGVLHLYMERPGIFIGVKGKDFEAVCDYLRATYPQKFKTIKIHEYVNPIRRAVFSFEYAYGEYYND